jgi:cyclohexadieny/prephenate dehydrogenase
MEQKAIFGRVAIIGQGLIGSSIARAATHFSVVHNLVLTDASSNVRKRVAELGLGLVTETAREAARDADLVMICVPVGQCGPVAEEIRDHLKAGAIVCDVGSVKKAVVRDITPHLPKGVHFVPAHPVAGTEDSGPDAGLHDLFVNRWCILTPTENSEENAVRKVAEFWRALGSNVEQMSVERHDEVLALISHLPHLIAFTMVGTASHHEESTDSDVIKFSAGGFRDFTRIAASNPTMWRDVFLNNKETVLEMIGRFSEDLHVLTRAIRRGDGDTLLEQFSKSRIVRRRIVEAGQDTAAPDFGRHQHSAKSEAAVLRPYASSFE